MPKRFLIFACFINGFVLSTLAQKPERCSILKTDSILQAVCPGIARGEAFETWLSKKKDERSNLASRAVITLPVIVHVIHDGEVIGQGTNISQAQIHSQIDVLNEDFRRKAGTAGFNNDPVGADIELEFCLALVDPKGNVLAEPGIDRVNRKLAGFIEPPFSDNYSVSTIQPATFWNPNQYLNIWVIDLPGNELGFAQLPDASGLPGLNQFPGASSTDGVTIDPLNFGRVGNLRPIYDQGRTATHEVGHWLGLIHLDGDGGCEVDDYCDDTPTANTQHEGCDLSAFSCGSQDMVRNYMDYSDDFCMNIFTQDQKTRMRTVLEFSPRRGVLANSTVCNVPTSAPTPDFTASQTEGCQGLQVQFLDQSFNNAQVWRWSFPGGNPSESTEKDPVVSYNVPGTYDVSLIVSNGFGSNGITKTAYIQVGQTGESRTIFVEDFETDISDWEIENVDNSFGWELTGVNGQVSGSRAMYINLFDYANTGQRDALISPKIDLRTGKEPLLYFEHAHAQFSNSFRDSLIIYASIDNGQTFPFRLFAEAENGSENFATSPLRTSPFFPSSVNDWCTGGFFGAVCTWIDLEEFEGESAFRLKFESYNANGNNLFLDNVRIEANCEEISTHNTNLLEERLTRLFPNPNNGQMILELPQRSSETIEISLFNMLGQQIDKRFFQLSSIGNRVNIDYQILQGVYILKVKGKKWQASHQVFIHE